MKSVKPGRGPSMMGGIASIGAVIFGIIWTILAASMGGGLFALFGVVFIAIGIVQAVYQFRNATSRNRYSAFDITDGNEEPDPLNDRFGEPHEARATDGGRESDGEANFCPYCGAKLLPGYRFCKHCGKAIE